jgi:hypothetical protein
MGKIVRQQLDGFQPVAEWSADDPASFRAAQDVLRREIDAGYMAVRSEDGPNKSVTELPQDAELVILTMAMGGG